MIVEGFFLYMHRNECRKLRVQIKMFSNAGRRPFVDGICSVCVSNLTLVLPLADGCRALCSNVMLRDKVLSKLAKEELTNKMIR